MCSFFTSFVIIQYYGKQFYALIFEHILSRREDSRPRVCVRLSLPVLPGPCGSPSPEAVTVDRFPSTRRACSPTSSPTQDAVVPAEPAASWVGWWKRYAVIPTSISLAKVGGFPRAFAFPLSAACAQDGLAPAVLRLGLCVHFNHRKRHWKRHCWGKYNRKAFG